MKALTGTFKILMLIALVLSTVASARADEAPLAKMTAETHTVVIEKLEKALQKAKEDETVDLSPVRARLADLYAERARLKEMEEGKAACQNCTGALGDRERALVLYSDVLKQCEPRSRGPIALQMAHLSFLVNKPAQAEKYFELIIKEGNRVHEKDVMASAYVGRGERRFERGDFKKAQSDFEAALLLSAPSRRGRIAHRIAWCELNQGEQETAVASLVSILKNPAYLKPQATDGEVSDVSFQEEVVHDLATFVARGNVSDAQMRLVSQYAPKDSKLEIMRHFASELERLGQKNAALIAWSNVAELEPSQQGKLEVLVRVARILYDRGEKADSQKSFVAAIELWKKTGCEEKVDCENMRRTLKNLVADWHKAERKKPSTALLNVYVSYLSKFDDDLEMTFQAATVAKDLKIAKQGIALYHKASILASTKTDATSKTIFNESLGGEIEMAELYPKGPESIAAREAAYDHYLKMAPNGEIAHKVAYQRARLPYESGDNQRAADRLAEFARSARCLNAKSADRGLCLQAANLDLDARVLLKDDAGVEKSATAYSKFYADQKVEFLKIARTAALNQSTKMDEASALVKIDSIDMTGATAEERLKVIKTRLTLSEKVKDLARVRSAANDLLKFKGLTPKDREIALSRLAWAAEMSFDFKTAYELNKRMQTPGMTAADRELRLAMFAELAGMNPKQHEEAFLAKSHNPLQRAVVRAKRIRAQKYPIAMFRKYKSELARFPEVSAPLALELYVRSHLRAFGTEVLQIRSIANHSAGRAIARQLFLEDFAKVDRSIAQHRIARGSDRAMQTTLAQRIHLIGSVEKQANNAIRSRDWTAQLVTLATLSRENKRLYNDILTLPVPRRLKGQERVNYMTLVEQNANVYLAKHRAIEDKLAQFWQDKAAFESLMNDYESSRAEVRQALASELRAIAQVAPSGMKQRITSAVARGTERPAQMDIKVALEDARQKPFNTSRLEVLRELQKSSGRETMVAYLDARMTHLKQESKQ
jgi:hypothetical protein